ncbi:MAG: hypothetical protein K8T20_11555 [Planctomycetes bacterium]|nr:hypothetical protein [Planctomycetota bacterium]
MKLLHRATWLLFLATLPACTGCAYVQDRGKDFSEIWRGGIGISPISAFAQVRVGDVVHFGAGGHCPTVLVGYTYGSPEREYLGEAQFGFFHAATCFLPCDTLKGSTDSNWQTPPCIHCVGFLPCMTNEAVRTWMHRFDIEFRIVFFIAIDAGFSPGEFLDFLLGWVGVDLDPEKCDPPKGWKTGVPNPYLPGADEKPKEPEKPDEKR